MLLINWMAAANPLAGATAIPSDARVQLVQIVQIG